MFFPWRRNHEGHTNEYFFVVVLEDPQGCHSGRWYCVCKCVHFWGTELTVRAGSLDAAF